MLEPIAKSDWTPVRAAHLLNRAGFGGTPAEVDRIYQMGPRKAVDHFVDFDKIKSDFPAPAFVADGPPELPGRGFKKIPREERQKKIRELRRENVRALVALRGWWLERMRSTPRPLEEKMTLFWHGHFATGARKVKATYAMYLQNQTFRQHAVGNWKDLIVAISKDPAMLIYLDGARSSRRSPNENYGRELMELFTLGEGHYTEDDIQAAARAFTGWSLDRSTLSFVDRERMHDPGSKTFMGKTGNFGGNDIIDIILEQPEAAIFLTGKLWTYFAYSDPEPKVVEGLAQTFRESSYQLKPVLKQLFSSRAFYSKKAGRTQIKSPVQWLVGSVKALDAPLPPIGVSVYATSSLGQELFEPPNVKGWDGGYAWITTASLLQRYNLASALVEGGDEIKQVLGNRIQKAAKQGRVPDTTMDEMDDEPTAAQRKRRKAFMKRRLERMAAPVVDPDKALPAAFRTTKATAQEHLQWRLFHSKLRLQDTEAFQHFFEALPEPSEWTDDQIREVIHAMMSTPQYQLT